MSSSNSGIYEPLEGPATIRLLILAPGRNDDEVVCALLPMDLDADHLRSPEASERPLGGISMASIAPSEPGQAPLRFMIDFDLVADPETHEPRSHPFQRYFALSYVWGSTTDPMQITLMGERVSVTKNLHSALRRLRKPDLGLRVWVDALCINQADPVEKASQIALMTRIYQQADFVKADVAPVFENEEGLEKILRTIIAVGRKSEALEEAQPGHDADSRRAKRETGVVWNLFLSSQDHSMESQGLPPNDDPAWLPWQRTFTSPYFRRIWILQEYALARSIILMFGRLEVKAEGLERCVRLLQEYSVAANLFYTGMPDPDDATLVSSSVQGILSAQHMMTERAEAEGGEARYAKRNDLIYKLQRGRVLESGQPRDKLFAMMGLANDADNFKDLITYSPDVSVTDICLRFAKRFVERGHVVELLYQARRTLSVPNLPTWVPYWPQTGSGSILRIADIDSYEHAFTAAGKTSTEVEILPDDKLRVKGAIFDHVVALSNPLDPLVTQAPNHIQMNGPGFGFVHSVQFIVKGGMLSCEIDQYPTGESKEEVLFRTYVRGPPWHRADSPSAAEELESLRKSFWAQLEWVKLLQAVDGSPEAQRREEIEVQTALFKHDAAPRAYKRRFCVTKRGYFGFVPNTTEVGDSVGIICGAPIPFVLRAVDEQSEDGCYQLMGDCYVHGLMHGQALDFADVKVRNFCIV